MKTWTDAELAIDAQASLGEGPCWDANVGVLWWVDIDGERVHRYDPKTGADTSVAVGQPVGAVVPRASGGLVLAVRDGFATLDPASGKIDALVDVDKANAITRFNDGKVDSHGRFWAGTMGFQVEPDAGAFYRLDPDLTVTTVLKTVTVSNGLGWSPDDRTMYYIDSLAYTVDAFDFDVNSGGLSNRRTLVEIRGADGLPDGMAVDVDGYLWVAIAYGSCVRRYAPDGTLDGELRLPASIITSCAFGGPDLGDLYITSMSSGLGENVIEKTHAGGLWRFRPGVKGLPTNAFAG